MNPSSNNSPPDLTLATYEEVLGALEHCVYIIGHNSCSDGHHPNGFVVALEHGRRVVARTRSGLRSTLIPLHELVAANEPANG